MKWAWARWLLVACNGLVSLACIALSFMAWSGGTEHHVGNPVMFTVLPILSVAATFGALAYRQTQRQGRVLQTFIALAALFIAAPTQSLPLVLYGVFAIIASWWLGDFVTGEEPAPLEGTPDHVARVMWRSGKPDAAIRAELSARNVPADEIEKLMYELAVEEEVRQRMSPGR